MTQHDMFRLNFLLTERRALQQLRRSASWFGKTLLMASWLRDDNTEIESLTKQIQIKEINDVLSVPYNEWCRLRK